MEQDLVTVASIFLTSSVGILPFMFLGVEVGINPRKTTAWMKTVSKIHNRLALWKWGLLSQGGRKTLINVVLTNIPIYLFSFYRAPKAIIQKIIIIQRFFLSEGEEKQRNLC